MIDVRFVIAHSLWILGAAVVLAAFSYYEWLARERQMPLRRMLRVAWGWKVSIAGGVLLVASGFLLMESARWWE
jgi:multidrug efflux pump subunit AcrA (membrane-fusion protein)